MLTILHTESSAGWGGQEIRIVQESLGMTKKGHKVIIAAPEHSNIYKRSNEVNIYTLPSDFKKTPVSVLKIVSLINKEHPDIVNTHSSSDSWVATVAAKLSRVKPKVIRTRHLSTPISKSYFSRLLYEILPDAVITTGEEIRQRMMQDNRFDPSKIFSIPTGIDLERFNPAKVTPAFQSKGFSVGTVGVLRSWKGHKYLLQAILSISAVIPNAFFYIVGNGPQYNNLKKLAETLNVTDSVIFLGHREDIPEVIASFDVIVHPSYQNEGVPQSILQAMAMKKPVVASDAGSIKEVVINSKTGFLIRSRDSHLIAEKVIELYHNSQLRINFGNEGRKLVENNYTLDGMIEKMETLYEGLLRKRERSVVAS